MAVSPDGGRIVYTRNLNDFDLMEAPMAGGRVRELLATSRWEGMPAWAPMNQQFVFVTDRRGPMEIWLKSRAEGWERPLVTPQDFPGDPTRSFMGPVFSPDGSRISYTRSSAAGTFIRITLIAGGVPARLTSGQTYECPPDWSPDGAWLTFVRSGPDKLRLVKVRVGSSDAPVILTETEFHHVAQWSPIGEWITYAQRDGFGIISPDGKESRVLFKGRPPIMPAFWSKDGNTLYALTYNANKLVLYRCRYRGRPGKNHRRLGPRLPAILGTARHPLDSGSRRERRLRLVSSGEKKISGSSRVSSHLPDRWDASCERCAEEAEKTTRLW
jgi:Tol biopolymer transport system component